ncbi:MAG: response regulator transcription factor [Acidimicrobiales bacterium]|nr:response regulator transcription factor [Acidimicrobiales bacterium]
MNEDRRLRVLLVDDEPDMLVLLQAVVTATSWEVVGRATNAPDAMRLATQIEPDVAVVDYRMPGENGLELARRLKALRPRLTVVIFSAMDMEREAMASGFVDRFVRKGDLRHLRRVLDEVHEQHRPKAGDT